MRKPQPFTEALLNKWYGHFNTLYFNGQLPAGVPVKFHRLKKQLGVTIFLDDYPVCINLDTRLKNGDFSRTMMTLLHEMCHVENYRGHKKHGPKFQKRMLRLAKLGAFKEWW